MMKKKYLEKFERWSGRLEDACYELMEMINQENEDRKKDAFQFICENIKNIKSNNSVEVKPYFAENEIDLLSQMYSDFIDEAIYTSKYKADFYNKTKEEFYDILWKTVFCAPLLTTPKEKAFGLLWIIVDNKIPYVNIGHGLNVEEDEFKRISIENRAVVDKIRYILNYPFEKKTQLASLLLDEILGLKSYKNQVVGLVYLLEDYAQRFPNKGDE